MPQRNHLSSIMEQPLMEHSQKNQREHFDDYLTYLLSAIGFAVGYGSFWRFPSLVYKHGGGAFLIPYFVVMVFLGVPLLYLETAVGQMHQTTLPRIFARINRGFKMFGYIIIFIAFGESVFYNILLTYSYRFIFVCFQSPLPFLNEPATSNEYFKNVILHKSASIDEFGSIHWELALLYIFSIWVCYTVIRQGLQIGGKILIVTVIGPYVFLVILGLRALSLQGSFEGIKYLFTPDFSRLFTGEIWKDATVQVFFQMSIASAGLINFASLKKKTQSFMSIIYLLPVSITLCGLLCACVVFMYVGHFCHQESILISNLTLSGPELAFSVVPKAIASLPWSNFWLLVFSTVLIFLGIDSEFGFMEAVVGAIHQDLKERNHVVLGCKVETKHVYMGTALAMVVFFPLFASSAGIYYLSFFDSFITNIGLPLGAFVQLYAFVYLFEFQKLEAEVENQTGNKTPSFIGWILKSKLMVVVMLVVLLIGLVNQLLMFQEYTLGKYVFGWILTSYPFIIALVYCKLYRTQTNRVTFEEIEQYQRDGKSMEMETM